ncbi:MAG: hypothetical protein ACYC5A_06190 [Thermoleophilia bacterium]
MIDRQQAEFMQMIFDSYPDPVFVLDQDQCVVSLNRAAHDYVKEDASPMLRQRKGDVLHCLNAANSHDGCGSGVLCGECVINNVVAGALRGEKIVREKTSLAVVSDDSTVVTDFLVTASPFAFNGDRFALLILEDISELTRLKSIIPICMGCKKVRDDRQYWENVDSYFEKYLDLSFSHGLCPDCVKKIYPEFSDDE